MGSPIKHEQIRRVLARNLKHLLAQAEMSENALAKKIKLSQKQVNNITSRRTGCGIDALQEIAGIFGVEPWMLIFDGGDRIIKPQRVSRCMNSYLSASDDDRDLIEALISKTVGRRGAA
jgi:transcriptional regulator with XRE-family HTH domain